MAILEINTVEDALLYFSGETPLPDDIENISVGGGLGLTIRLPHGYHSDVPGPYIDAYFRKQQSIYRIVALISNGSSDIKTLNQDQIEEYQFKLHVEEGSSRLEDNAVELLTRLLAEAVTKMSPDQVFYSIVGFLILVGTGWGFRAYLTHRKEIRLEEISSEERRHTVEAMSLGSTEQAELFRAVINKMDGSGEIGKKAASASDAVLSRALRWSAP